MSSPSSAGYVFKKREMTAYSALNGQVVPLVGQRFYQRQIRFADVGFPATLVSVPFAANSLIVFDRFALFMLRDDQVAGRGLGDSRREFVDDSFEFLLAFDDGL